VIDQETLRVGHMQLPHTFHEGFSRYAFLLRLDHGGGTVGVIGANVNRLMAAHALKPHPDIGLDLLQYMTQVDWAVGVGQCASD
jgi:hypothetical protein